ncbi:hypothetical protein B0A49_01525 [Cryomyces minteri]|uniref:Uncharacterized protein n=1 Tax=Cryomyces minteri TaxID=331657 RepID=A0A4U0XTJ7_9PEZI|nr:hypothetical protein B0A49_09278 [Cryomyces minteri]TKA81014.1 hypothetical protein B0A49_01525 [Cryomyces minteri]
MALSSMTIIGNQTHYGMFAPPGLSPLGQVLEISLMANATLPFIIVSASIPPFFSDSYDYRDPLFDPPLPVFPQAYGFNHLLLSNTSAAMLDTLLPNYVAKVQALLDPTEAWHITAIVHGTVSTYNNAVESHRNDSAWWTQWHSDGGLQSHVLYNGWNIALLGNQNSAVQLVKGSCNATALPRDNQLIFTHNHLALNDWFMPQLLKYLGPFSTIRNSSH